ncbi:MAG: DUF2892 domain-containing protein [Alphaproteobacteria bacterium]|nr:DUF2892 domain-containing protein [Alphaproteobacteria bacterium]
MSIDRIVMAFAGIVILASVGLVVFAHIAWAIWIAAFVGANLLQAAFTGFCPMAMILKKLGAKPGQAFT